MSKRLTYLVGIVGVLAGCGVFFAWALQDAYNTTLPIAEAGEAFMVALQEDRFDDAYAMISPVWRDDLAFADFEDSFTGFNLASWDFNSREIWNEVGGLDGTAIINDRSFDLRFEFVDNGAGWQLISYDFLPVN